ncbi:hypothetical protein ACJMK2_009447 [Sinanodonta woodiana]|uniref:THD domain-containing protein n=1 Tax=Sinanodonta woodiana TaxID=1069815 RepID=A0ABD3VDY2_SINWO
MMNQTLEDSKQINTVPDHQYRPSHNEESALLTENKTEEQDGRVQVYSSYVDEANISRSNEPYLYSVDGAKRQCSCHLTHCEIKDEQNIAEENRAGKPILIPQGIHLRKKRGHHECVIKEKYIQICLLVSIVVKIGLVLTVVFLATQVGRNTRLKGENYSLLHLPKEYLQDALCIPCDDLVSTIKADDSLFDSVSLYGSKFCCVKNGSLQKLFLLMLQEGYTSKATEQLTLQNYADINTTLKTSLSRINAAHVYANVTSLPEKLTWQTDSGFGTAFTQGIVLTRESRLQVPRAGFYFIYSLVTFKCQSESTNDLIHLINRQHRGRPNAGVQQLLLSKTSECGPDGFYTSFLAGVLKLKINDELSVNLTDFSLTCVYKATFSNYFGLYLI